MWKGPVFNIVVNTTAAVGLWKVMSDENDAKDVAAIVAIDTLFRIALSHTISALKMTPSEPKTVGNLIFLCSTLATQQLSVEIAKRAFKVKAPTYLNTMAYIFFGWKVNLMVKGAYYTSFLGRSS